jgi:hypothetical protein
MILITTNLVTVATSEFAVHNFENSVSKAYLIIHESVRLHQLYHPNTWKDKQLNTQMQKFSKNVVLANNKLLKRG